MELVTVIAECGHVMLFIMDEPVPVCKGEWVLYKLYVHPMRHLLPPCLIMVSSGCVLRVHSYSFLFKGDGRAVAIQTRSQPTDAHPRASFDRSLPPSYSL